MLGHVVNLLIHRQPVEKRMPQTFAERYPRSGIVFEHPGHQVEHHALLLALDGVGAATPVLRQRPAMLGCVTGSWQTPVPRESTCMEVIRVGPADQMRGDVAEDPGHHREVLQIVVRLEQRVTLVKLKNDASSAPDVTGLTPSQFENHFGRSVVARRDDARVVLPVERRAPEVDQLDPRVPHPPDSALRGGTQLGVPVATDEQDVLRLEVGVRQVIFMQKLDSIAELVGDVAHLLQRIADVPVALQEVEHGLTEDLERQAHVAEIIERVEHFHAQMFAARVLCVQLLQHVDLQLGRLAIFMNVLDDLHRHVAALVVILHFHHFAERAFSQRRDDLVAFAHPVARQVG